MSIEGAVGGAYPRTGAASLDAAAGVDRTQTYPGQAGVRHLRLLHTCASSLYAMAVFLVLSALYAPNTFPYSRCLLPGYHFGLRKGALVLPATSRISRCNRRGSDSHTWFLGGSHTNCSKSRRSGLWYVSCNDTIPAGPDRLRGDRVGYRNRPGYRTGREWRWAAGCRSNELFRRSSLLLDLSHHPSWQAASSGSGIWESDPRVVPGPGGRRANRNPGS